MPTARSIAASYDRLPYVSDAIHQTNPSRLAALARIHGMRPASSDSCRVLELGCGNGGNLLPLAEVFPDSTFVGVDVSGKAVRRGRSVVEEIGLSNVRLQEGDIRGIDDGLGTFDYVIAHGVYSWVPSDVQDALLRVIGERLADRGVAYVSYNLLPGRYVDLISRDLMRFHVDGIDEPEARAEQALAFLQLAAQAATEPSTYGDVLEEEADRLARYPPWFLLHDHLGDHTSSIYFHDFVEHAAAHGLSFLTEADFEVTTTFGLRDDVAAQLKPLQDRFILYQQYLDYLRGGRFRRTLLCREDVAVDRSPRADRLDGLFVAAPVAADPGGAAAPVRLVGLRDQQIQTDQPLAIAVLEAVGRAWPAGIAFGELVDLGLEAMRGTSDAAGERGEEVRPDDVPATVAHLLLSLLGNAFLELRDYDPPLCTEPGERPQTTRVARRQAAHSTLVTNVLHRSVPVEEDDARHLLRRLDGLRTRGELLEDLRRTIGRQVEEDRIESLLRRFARDGLLTS